MRVPLVLGKLPYLFKSCLCPPTQTTFACRSKQFGPRILQNHPCQWLAPGKPLIVNVGMVLLVVVVIVIKMIVIKSNNNTINSLANRLHLVCHYLWE